MKSQKQHLPDLVTSLKEIWIISGHYPRTCKLRRITCAVLKSVYLRTCKPVSSDLVKTGPSSALESLAALAVIKAIVSDVNWVSSCHLNGAMQRA